jgi:hypothetical protein
MKVASGRAGGRQPVKGVPIPREQLARGTQFASLDRCAQSRTIGLPSGWREPRWFTGSSSAGIA